MLFFLCRLYCGLKAAVKGSENISRRSLPFSGIWTSEPICFWLEDALFLTIRRLAGSLPTLCLGRSLLVEFPRHLLNPFAQLSRPTNQFFYTFVRFLQSGTFRTLPCFSSLFLKAPYFKHLLV